MNSTKSFRESLVIPPTPPTDEHTSNICKVRYVLRITGAIKGCHRDIVLDLPVTIGSYPILDELNITSYPTEVNDDAARRLLPIAAPAQPQYTGHDAPPAYADNAVASSPYPDYGKFHSMKERSENSD